MSQTNNDKGKLFQVHRVSIMALSGLAYAIALFHKFAPAVLCNTMAESFGVTAADLSIFSSMYFWTYAVVQPFCGMISDVADPGIIIGLATLLVAAGSLIIGVAQSLTIAIIGRFLVGVGSGLSYVPTCRIFLTWFHTKLYGVLSGIMLSAGACGGVIAQGPLASMAASIGWRQAFYISAGIGLIVGILCLIFIRVSPEKFGYPSVTGAEPCIEDHRTFKEHISLLSRNFLGVVKQKQFWILTPFFLLQNGSFIGFTGLWAGPYLQDIFGYSTQTAGNVMMVFTIAQIAGAFILPFIVLKIPATYQQWILVLCSFIAMICAILFATLDTVMNMATVITIFAIDTIVSTAIASVSFPFARLCFRPEVGATVIGCLNFWSFFGSAAIQNLTGVLMKQFHIEGTDKYEHRGYILVVWVMTICCDIIPTISSAFAKSITDVDEDSSKSDVNFSSVDNEEEDDVHDHVVEEIPEL